MKKLFILSLLLLMLTAYGVSASAQGYGLSPAIGVLKSQTVMQKCGITEKTVNFSKADFENVIGKEVTYIVVTSLPAENAGVLTLNNQKVVEGQTIPVSALSYLVFTPASKDVAKTSFSFRAGTENWTETDIPCVITLKNSVNVAPIAASEDITTLANIPVFHQLAITDPNGDNMQVNIQTYPANGSLKVNRDGVIEYTPFEGYRGRDSFSYTVSDEFGLVSEIATVNVKVEKNTKNITFADMAGNDAYSCAVMVAQSDVMTYELREGEYFFSPTEKVKKIDYLVMLITAMGMDKQAEICEDTLFEDDNVLTNVAKGYLALALREDIVTLGNGKFEPTKNITGGEAEQMTIAALNAAGYGGIFASGQDKDAELTKADVAKLLAKAMKNK
ncbi:MAG: cadherin-like domain-containing protein [Clostridia bacterium]|nr:cadherin-like domain-containing protein [Clostridia bacterium]